MQSLERNQVPPRRTRRVREAAAFVLLACACGMAARTMPAGVPAVRRETAASPPESDAVPVANRFESIEARGPSIAPGMRAAVRRESTGEKIELVRAEQRDTCVRVAFEATVPVVAKLVDGTDRTLAETGTASIDGVLGEKGPICIRKGETLSVLVNGPRTRIRWVAWVAP
jgi:hypothetical protein